MTPEQEAAVVEAVARALLAARYGPVADSIWRVKWARIEGTDPYLPRQARAAMAAHTRAMEGVTGWRDIETAPKDGTWVLSCIAGSLIPFVAAYDDDGSEPCWFSFNRRASNLTALSWLRSACWWRGLGLPFREPCSCRRTPCWN